MVDSIPVSLRPGRWRDVPGMVRLIERKRAAYEQAQPVFWKRAATAAARTTAWYRLALLRPRTIVLVATRNGDPCGFLIAMPTRVPPVYDPGGPTVTVDDFAVADDDWTGIGMPLLTELRRIGRIRHWRQIVVIAGAADAAKLALLRDMDLAIASTWWVGEV